MCTHLLRTVPYLRRRAACPGWATAARTPYADQPWARRAYSGPCHRRPYWGDNQRTVPLQVLSDIGGISPLPRLSSLNLAGNGLKSLDGLAVDGM